MIDLLEIIASIEAEKKDKGIAPSHAMLYEIIQKVDSSVKPELNKLVSEGKITWCETLNSFGFKTIKT